MGSRSRFIELILLARLLLGARADAATAYRFVAKTDGVYATERSGVVLVDGDRWRVSYDAKPDDVPVLTRVISAGGGAIAINDTNRTWYRVKSRDVFASTSSLFSFGLSPAVKGLEVKTESEQILFSYRLVTSGVTVRVFGVIRMCFRTDGSAASLPWSPLRIATGIGEVDAALREAFAKVKGAPWRTDTEVSRRVEDGAVLRQLITRSIEPATPAHATAADFAIPAAYVNQQPVLGVPGP
jgi:hypothetical protein